MLPWRQMNLIKVLILSSMVALVAACKPSSDPEPISKNPNVSSVSPDQISTPPTAPGQAATGKEDVPLAQQGSTAPGNEMPSAEAGGK